MINQNLVKRLWNEREEHISTKQLIREVKEGYKEGKHFKTVAKELRESNRIIAENA